MSAQREDELDNPIKCWLGCPVMEKIELMGVHVRKKCTFRNIECDLCRNIFKEVDIYRHKLRDCPQRLVGHSFTHSLTHSLTLTHSHSLRLP